jgi:hypothetical protein
LFFMTFSAFLLYFVLHLVPCFRQQLCQAPESSSHPSRGHVCPILQAACPSSQAHIWFLSRSILFLPGTGTDRKPPELNTSARRPQAVGDTRNKL